MQLSQTHPYLGSVGLLIGECKILTNIVNVNSKNLFKLNFD